MGIMKIPPQITDVVAEPGPNARAMLEERLVQYDREPRWASDGMSERGPLGTMCIHHGRYEPCVICAPKQPSPRPMLDRITSDEITQAMRAPRQPSPRPTVTRVLDIVRTVIRARRQACYQQGTQDDRDEELARAIVTNVAAEIATGDE